MIISRSNRSALRRVLYVKQRGLCHYCRKKMRLHVNSRSGKPRPDGCTLEHLKPLSKGGQDTFENCVAACLSCNNARGSMPVEEWTALCAARVTVVA